MQHARVRRHGGAAARRRGMLGCGGAVAHRRGMLGCSGAVARRCGGGAAALVVVNL